MAAHEPVPLSVVIPAYDRETMVGRAIASAWAQHPRPPAEVIVVDDCSSDRTAEVAESLGARVIRHEVNRGLGASRNTGIRAASHQWIALLDSDDEWLPHLVDTLWHLRDDHVLVGAASLNCGDDPARDRFAGPTSREPLVLTSPAELVYPENFVAASGTMVRADVVHAAGGFREELSHCEDLDLWLRVLEHGTGLITPVVGVIYHLHDGQVTRDQETMATRQLEVMRSYSSRPWWSASRVEARRAADAWDLLRRGETPTKLRCAAFIGRHPARIAGLGGLLVRRHRLRRRSAAVTRHGTPSVAILSGKPERRAQLARAVGDDRVHVASKLGLAGALVALWRRPAGIAVADSAAARAIARLAGVRAVSPAKLAELTQRPWSPAAP